MDSRDDTGAIVSHEKRRTVRRENAYGDAARRGDDCVGLRRFIGFPWRCRDHSA
jgi:hypothetical protein